MSIVSSSEYIEIRAAEIIQELHECQRKNIPTISITPGERMGWAGAKYGTDYHLSCGATYHAWWAGWLAFEATKES